MALQRFIEKISQEIRIAFAIFDENLIIEDTSENIRHYVHSALSPKKSMLYDIFPELTGYEDLIIDLMQKRKGKLELEKLSRFSRDGKIRFYDFLLLPFQEDLLSRVQLLCIVTDTTLETSLEQKIQQQKYEILLLRSSLVTSFHQDMEIIGESEKIHAIRNFVKKISQVKNTTILLEGESGTGKNLVARAIHRNSMSEKAPFVEINCASIPATLLESEIFGYEKGAFTNAIMSKKGLLEEANGGTFFLDEIGELPLSMQVKFLSFLENKTFRRLGSTQEQSVKVRIIAATNRDLKDAVQKDEFREDLYYRLNVVSMILPPLRELENDVLLLADNFIQLYAFDFHKSIKGLTEPAKQKLLRHHWPGNVRELRNVIERAVIFAETSAIDSDDLWIQHSSQQWEQGSTEISIPESGLSIYEVEKNLLHQAIHKADGNQTKAAKLLGLTLDTFRYRLKKYDLAQS